MQSFEVETFVNCANNSVKMEHIIFYRQWKWLWIFTTKKIVTLTVWSMKLL